ncbi:hypothetical protein Q5H93_11785 [Hymenobacter sp. ASUV-10]|uniref:Uncharacterized protein n=1 Tax=Hymenobacter aranciens TaxID=3063996 RepID=A0ABT9BFX5_9BACT|nr:hypothetical protein [Hymenobacter sp. ASUV-10]MDO7875413.1 hypothetical protein [Hymenobacter sp. ASUV-10]
MAHRATRPATPQMKAVRVVGAKCIWAGCEKIGGKVMYTYFVAYGETEPPLSDFRFLLNSTSAHEELTVESGKRPWVCMLATNSAGMSEYSAPMGLLVV